MQTVTRWSVPVPPVLEAALGSPGTARSVALDWRPAGDARRGHEGWRSAEGAWHSWRTCTRHPRVAPALAPDTCSDFDIPTMAARTAR